MEKIQQELTNFYNENKSLARGIIVVIAIFTLVLTYLYFEKTGEGTDGPLEEYDIASESVEEIEIEESFFVEISGQVMNPGVYELNKNLLIIELLGMSGGLTDEADLSYVHKEMSLAVEVVSGGNYYFPSKYDASIGSSDDSSGNAVISVNSQISINSATKEELQLISGIGEKTAEDIIANRPYQSIDELNSVSGIGEKTFTKISQYLSL